MPDPKKPDFSNVQSGSSSTAPGSGKPDFSNVQSGSSSTAPGSGKPDFSNVQSGSSSTATPETTYTVVPGDSLSRIAKKLYGDARKWQTIFEANKDTIKNPDLIHPGQTLKIPKA